MKETIEEQYKRIGVKIPEIILPAKGTDLVRWSVIACDQYTSQPDYWERVDAEVGDSPSTLRLTFPEIYLKDDDREERIGKINATMRKYLEQGILEPQKPGFVLVDRSTPHAASRKGLILALDLECYDYREGSQTLIRATEGTVLDRIPPRVKIRENAPIELPHIMVLIDDPGRSVIEPLFKKAAAGSYQKLYDFELMQGGGHIRGWKVEDGESLALAADSLAKLAAKAGCGDGATFLFAVGDGNHSLAAAKAHWENVKAGLAQQCGSAGRTPQEQSTGRQPGSSANWKADSGTACIPEHPARYALVEVVNVHDEGLVFEPIHRVLFGVDRTILDEMKKISGDINGSAAEYMLFASKEAMEAAGKRAASANDAPGSCSGTSLHAHILPFILEGAYGLFIVKNPSCSLEAGTLQNILDQLAKAGKHPEIDYIHGEKVVTELGSKKNSMGFYLPVMNKNDLFETVKRDGVLPRKTFSMGEAEEKRYYLECRRIM